MNLQGDRQEWLHETGTEPASVRISAIVACYRDEEAVPLMHARLTETFHQIGVDYEIIFVNDASPDDAAKVLADLAHKDPRVVVVNHSRAFGSQSAFTSGMLIATGDAVVLLDGDLQDPPELIADFYLKWREGYQIVYGQRVKRDASRPMRFAYKGFYRLFRRLAYVNIPLDAGDFSLMDRRVVDELNRLPESQRFLRGLRAWVGFNAVGVPYVRPERMFGRTTNSLIKNLMWARRGIVSFSYAPLELILMIAIASVIIAVVAGVVQISLKLADPSSVPSGFTTLILLILMMGGLILLALSIIGFYIADIYTEVKKRPPFVVESVLNRPTPRSKTYDEGGKAASDA
ncbi:MAG TPA: glycosyltransferase family 2 protein [Acidimicrobiales bacterium]|nr:glycosyltransferase family 2 protein [Acidimicrobiales bacterium]